MSADFWYGFATGLGGAIIGMFLSYWYMRRH